MALKKQTKIDELSKKKAFCLSISERVPIVKKFFVVLVLSFAVIQYCHAWGHEGHRLTALVAQDHLTTVAEENIRYLLGKESLADIASWADEYREDHRETSRWHYVDISGAQNTYDRMRDCPLPEASPESKWRDCVVDRIVYFEEQLKSHDTDKKQKVIALKFLVHLIGDIHQPFHAIGDAHGSNNIHVVFLGTTQCGEHSLCNLHGVWDESLLEHHNWKEKKYLAMLRSEILENNWKKQDEGDPAAWANTSHRYAQDAFVDNGALISSKYYEAEIKIVDQQLALGGLRLAEVLNGIFTLSPPPK
jgi:S1/P1 Nuclease